VQVSAASLADGDGQSTVLREILLANTRLPCVLSLIITRLQAALDIVLNGTDFSLACDLLCSSPAHTNLRNREMTVVV
jgi:hypothetical protein